MISMLLQSQQAMQMQMLKESQDARAAERDARAAEREVRAAEIKKVEAIIARLGESQKKSAVCVLM